MEPGPLVQSPIPAGQSPTPPNLQHEQDSWLSPHHNKTSTLQHLYPAIFNGQHIHLHRLVIIRRPRDHNVFVAVGISALLINFRRIATDFTHDNTNIAIAKSLTKSPTFIYDLDATCWRPCFLWSVFIGEPVNPCAIIIAYIFELQDNSSMANKIRSGRVGPSY